MQCSNSNVMSTSRALGTSHSPAGGSCLIIFSDRSRPRAPWLSMSETCDAALHLGASVPRLWSGSLSATRHTPCGLVAAPLPSLSFPRDHRPSFVPFYTSRVPRPKCLVSPKVLSAIHSFLHLPRPALHGN